MPGCLDKCLLFWESHDIENVDSQTQIRIEKELKKFEEGEEYDPEVLKGVLKMHCLWGYLKDPNEPKSSCKKYIRLIDDLPLQAQLEIHKSKLEKKWKIITFSVSILAIVISSLFAYLNYSKSTPEELQTDIKNLKKIIKENENEIRDKDIMIRTLQEKNSKSSGGNNE